MNSWQILIVQAKLLFITLLIALIQAFKETVWIYICFFRMWHIAQNLNVRNQMRLFRF